MGRYVRLADGVLVRQLAEAVPPPGVVDGAEALRSRIPRARA